MTTAQPTTVVGHRKQIVDGGCAVAGLGHNPRQVQTIHGVGHDGALRREREKEKEKERERAQRAQREHTHVENEWCQYIGRCPSPSTPQGIDVLLDFFAVHKTGAEAGFENETFQMQHQDLSRAVDGHFFKRWREQRTSRGISTVDSQVPLGVHFLP